MSCPICQTHFCKYLHLLIATTQANSDVQVTYAAHGSTRTTHTHTTTTPRTSTASSASWTAPKAKKMPCNSVADAALNKPQNSGSRKPYAKIVVPYLQLLKIGPALSLQLHDPLRERLRSKCSCSCSCLLRRHLAAEAQPLARLYAPLNDPKWPLQTYLTTHAEPCHKPRKA
jgi:hypothetical protein